MVNPNRANVADYMMDFMKLLCIHILVDLSKRLLHRSPDHFWGYYRTEERRGEN